MAILPLLHPLILITIKLEDDGWYLCGKVRNADETLVDMMTDGYLNYLTVWMD